MGTLPVQPVPLIRNEDHGNCRTSLLCVHLNVKKGRAYVCPEKWLRYSRFKLQVMQTSRE